MKKDTRDIASGIVLILQLGLNVITCIALAGAIGWFIDYKLGTQVWFIVFLFIGFAAAYSNAYKMLKGVYGKHKTRKEKTFEYIENLKKQGEVKRKHSGEVHGK